MAKTLSHQDKELCGGDSCVAVLGGGFLPFPFSPFLVYYSLNEALQLFH